MSHVTIRNVDIDFPFTPYKCQEDYMSHVIEALQLKQNAILESPTGTGKTLCLLCSVLAWRLTYIAKMQLNGFSSSSSIKGLNEAVGIDKNESPEAFNAIPKIIYASRTHSQISQVVSELKNTIYKPKVSVIGSREQLCLHPKVMNIENSTAKIHACRAKVKERSCVHHSNVEKKIQDTAFNAILDIEELVAVSKEKTMCPYFSSRELLKNADVIFMPYNYLIDSKSRKNLSISLENAIVIFDEAHNIEKVCEESYSFEITSSDIANCIENCQITLQRILDEGSDGDGSLDNNELSKEDVLTMKAIFLSLEREFNKIEIKGEGSIIDKSTFKNLLTSINVNQETKGLITEVLQKMEAVLSMSTNNKLVGNTFLVLNNFMQILDLTLEQNESTQQTYICYISKERIDKKGPKGWVDKNIESVAPRYITKLSYWCFSPGIAMQDFIRQGVYSIILTSGTLSPINSFSSELKIPFPITLQNPHVIDSSQISVQVLCKGWDGVEFLSTYKNRSNPKYLASLGNSIVNLLRIIPSGVLVFFPSYAVMNSTIQSWQETNIYSRMAKTKHCFIEPRSKNDMANVMNEFDSKVRTPSDGATGAILFAVCRGKASEGIDFADMHGRAVIITGLPFPPRVDPKVNAKINFLDKQKKVVSESLNGNQWYVQQSSRAVNQAVGRVIRHKNDFGAVIFMDKRFSFRSNIDELPKWTKDFTKTHEKFGSGLKELSQFFKVHVNREVEKVEKLKGPTLTKSYSGRLSNMYEAFQQNEKELPNQGFNHVNSQSNLTDQQEHTPPPCKIARKDNRISLITSLSNTSSPSFNFEPSLSPVTSKSHIGDYKTPEALRNPRKRIRIVTNSNKIIKDEIFCQGSSNQIDSQSSRSYDNKLTVKSGSMQACSQINHPLEPESLSNETNTSSDPSSSKENRAKNCKDYSLLLRSSLNHAEYETFKSIIAKYRRNSDINILIDNIGQLLLTNHKNLLKGFRVFLNARDKPIFDKFAAESWFAK